MWKTIKEAMILHQAYGYIRLGKEYAKKYRDSISLQFQPKHWGGKVSTIN